MNVNRLFQMLVPKENKFFPLFVKDSENLVRASGYLENYMTTDDLKTREELNNKIKECEKAGDEITHQIFDELNKTFITPFDRDDISRLASSLDDVMDYINASAQKIKLYKPKSLPPEFIKISGYIVNVTEQLNISMHGLRNLKKSDAIRQACIRINEIENLTDDVYHASLSSLFENEKDAIELIKKKEVIRALEVATDKAEDVADVLRTILVKLA